LPGGLRCAGAQLRPAFFVGLFFWLEMRAAPYQHIYEPMFWWAGRHSDCKVVLLLKAAARYFEKFALYIYIN
jgi:hypothetical protein